MSQRLTKSFRRVKAMIADMHHMVSSWLSRNYKEVLLPSFQTSDMTSRQKRISSKTSRAMLTWSHYKFKKMLEYKMERSGGKMIECEERYTTKTCSRCGRINHSITSEKVFKCSECHLTMDRDVNAARNIYLKNEYLLTWALRVRVPGDAFSEVVRCV
jgi:putative transposase